VKAPRRHRAIAVSVALNIVRLARPV